MELKDLGIKCRILEVHPDTHSITIRYFSDTITQDSLASEFGPNKNILRRKDGTPVRCKSDVHIQLPVPAPKGTELLDYIFKNVPPSKTFFELQENIANPDVDTSLSHIVEMANSPHPFLVPKEVMNREHGIPRRKVIARSDVGVPAVKVEEF